VAGGENVLAAISVGSTSPQTTAIQWPGMWHWDQLVIQCFLT